MVPFIFLFGALGATAMEAPEKDDSSSCKRSFTEMNDSQDSVPAINSDTENKSSKRPRQEEVEEVENEITNPPPISLLSGESDHLCSTEILNIAKKNPTLPIISFDMAYGHTLEDFTEKWECKLENFDGVEIFLKTATDRVSHFITSSHQIEDTEKLYGLIPVGLEIDIPAAALASLRSELIFSLQDFPLQVTFKLNSGHAGMNPPTEYGVIASDGSERNLTKWDLSYYALNEIYTAPSITLEGLFPADEPAKRTVVLAHTEGQFPGPAELYFFDKPLDQISQTAVVFNAKFDEHGNEVGTLLINEKTYEGKDEEEY